MGEGPPAASGPRGGASLAGEPIHGGMKNDPRQFAGAKTCIEPFKPLEFLHHALGHPELAARRVDLLGGGHQTEHALLGKPAREAADRFRMRPGFLRPLRPVWAESRSNGRMSS